MKLVNFTIQENGDLKICRLMSDEETKGWREENHGNAHLLTELIDHQLCNGWEMIQPEEIGALTDAPILSQDVSRNDDGEIKYIGDVFWFPNYMVIDPIEEILTKGHVIFNRVGHD